MLCNNIGLVLACPPCGSTNASASPSQNMTQPSGIPILSPVLFMHVGDPYIPPFNIRRIFDLLVLPPFLVSFREVETRVYMYIHIILTEKLTSSSPSRLFLHCSITMRFVTTNTAGFAHGFIATYIGASVMR